MTKRDSWLVKNVKKLERLGDRANSNLSEYYFYKSAEGEAAEAIDHISEVVYEALIRYDEMKAEEKREAQREKIEERLERLRERKAKKCNAKPSKKMENVVINPPSKATPIATRMADLFHRVISMGGEQ